MYGHIQQKMPCCQPTFVILQKKLKLANEKDFRKRSNLAHEYYKRKGGYRFLGKNFLKLLASMVVLAAGLYAFSTYVLDIKDATDFIFKRFNPYVIIGTLFLSESFLGILPPDLYILWAKEMDYSYLLVLILAVVSYLGGIISYLYGTQLVKFTAIDRFVHVKFKEQFEQLRRFGGLFIFLAAMTPLPFSPVSVVAGVVEFPFSKYLFIALARFLRFFLYALVIFQFV